MKFFFQIKDSTGRPCVTDFVKADSFGEAKTIAHREYGSVFNRLEWIGRPGDLAAAEAILLRKID